MLIRFSPDAGATPVADGATPSQSQPATPAPGATPAASTAPATGQPQPGNAGATPDDEAQLGEAGKRAIAAERQKAKDAEEASRRLQARVEELENATASEQEKAVKAARKEGEEAERDKWLPIIRQLRIEGSLRDAGCTKPALAARSPDFDDLKVSETGTIADLDKTVEAFKSANPDLFGQQAPATGDFGNGQRGGTPPPAQSLEEAITRQLSGQGG